MNFSGNYDHSVGGGFDTGLPWVMANNAVPFSRGGYDWRSLVQNSYRQDELNPRLDDSALGAFVNELVEIEKRLRETEYDEYPAAEGRMFAIKEMNQPAIMETGWRQIDYIGEMQLESENSTNLPLTEIVTQEFRNKVANYRGGYRISDRDMIRASYVGLDLVSKYVAACNKSYKQTLNKLLLYGDPKTREPGFLNHPAWLRCKSPYRLNSSVTDPNNLVEALTFGVRAMRKANNDAMGFEPDTLLLPYDEYEYLSSQVRMGPNLEKPVLKWWLETKQDTSIKTVKPIKYLRDAGPGGTPIAIYYRRTANDGDPPFEAMITQSFQFGRVHREVSGIVRTTSFGYGGFRTFRPNSVLIMEGI